MAPYAKYLLRLEGALVASLAFWYYGQAFGNWWLMVALFLLPDLSFVVFALNQKFGVRVYNIAHTYLVPAALAGIAQLSQLDWLMAVAVIWVFHISVDRLVGYGLKSESDHKRNHLN